MMSQTLKTSLIVFLLLTLGAGGLWWFMATKKTAKRTPPPVSSPMVTTIPAVSGTVELAVKALGTVKAAQQTAIRARVSGTVEELGTHFDSGGLVKEGEVLLRLDEEDYKNTLKQKESALAKAKADYDLEMGQQKVARTEVKQLGKLMPESVKDSSLALRVPHLAQAKATVQAAEAEARQAKVNLERTTIVAPYNALVVERNVSLGSQASTSDTLATLASTDEYRVEAAIPLDRLLSLGLAKYEGIPAHVVTSTGQQREGVVLRTLGALDSTTRMGRVLVSIPDPLGLKNNAPPLMIGDHVKVELKAGQLEDVVTLPRSALRGGERVWVAVPEGNGYKLDIRPVNAAWRDTEIAYIDKGLKPGELIVTSTIGAPVQGMSIRLASERGKKPDTPTEGNNS